MATVTYIIPLHKFDALVQSRLPEAIASIEASDDKDFSIIFVGPNKVLSALDDKLKATYKFVENEDTDVYKQINAAVLCCTSQYFSVVEFDDKITPYWSKEAKKYGKNGASVLLPFYEFHKSGTYISLGNELAWDVSFADENNLGFLSMKELETYMDFPVHGALIRTEDFLSIGGLKPSLKIAAWYEFLLRCCYKNKAIYVVPKIGYIHALDTPESYTEIMHNEITPEEGKWLIETAKQEYFFKDDRGKKFGDE